MMEDKSFKITTEDGKEIVCDVLFTFDDDASNKQIMVYTDNTSDETGNVRAYASYYNEGDLENNTMKLDPITDEKVMKKIEIMFEALQEQIIEENKETK